MGLKLANKIAREILPVGEVNAFTHKDNGVACIQSFLDLIVEKWLQFVVAPK